MASGKEPDLWCLSDMDVTKVSYMWQIRKFSYVASRIRSPCFSPEGHPEIIWQLEIVPEERVEAATWVSCFLYNVSKCKGNVKANFGFSILNVQNKNAMVKLYASYDFVPGGGYGYRSYVLREVLLNSSSLLPNDTLSILCKIKMPISDMISKVGKRNYIELQDNYDWLSKNMSTILDNHEFSDVTLKVQDKEIHAHKCILASASPVFAAMFRHDMQEKTQNCVEITDAEPQAVHELLKCIYTGKKPDGLDKMAKELLTLSDKYDITVVKNQCEGYLSETLSVDSAAEVLAFADLHSADQLKTRTLEFISRNAKEVVETPAFKSLIKNQVFAVEVFRAISQESMK